MSRQLLQSVPPLGGPEVIDLAGVLSVLCTPFHDDGSLDLASLERLVEHNLAWSVDGIVCFGLAGEVYKLTDDERREVLRVVVDMVDGHVPVIAGSEHSGVEAAVARSVSAREAGASALMMFPPTFIKPDTAGILAYYAAVGAAVDVPIIVQDAPAWTGVALPVDLLAAVLSEVPQVRYVKVEAPPTALKMKALRDAGLKVIGGYGALHLAEELTQGPVAFMPGCAMPGLYRDLWAAHRAGDADTVRDLYSRALPLLVFQMGGLDTFVATQKMLLCRIAVLSSQRLRRPGAALTAEQTAWLDRVLFETDLECYVARRPPSGAG